jgi:Zn finger protein HypA/HybF involved in hydrogenase expression
MNEWSIKDDISYDLENNQYDIKRPNKYKKKKYCPECGNILKTKLLDGFLYCQKCHKRISGKIIDNTNLSVKEIKL